MYKKLLLLIVVSVSIFFGCDNGNIDFSYGEYPDSTTRNDDDSYNYKKDSDKEKKDADPKSDDSRFEEDLDETDDETSEEYEHGTENDSEGEEATPDEDWTTLPDTDTETPDTETPDTETPDVDIYIEPVCGNNVVETGEVCEPTISKPCNTIKPELYKSGWVICKEDCSDWIFTGCVEHPCSDMPDEPDPSFKDTNCDGIDGNIIESVFVDGLNGVNTNPGTIDLPVATIAKGIEVAENTGKKHVLVAGGAYNENIAFKSGISVHGAYSGHPNWIRGNVFTTLIRASADGLRGEWIGDFTLSFLTITGTDATGIGESSFGAFFKNCENIKFSNVKFIAGKGAAGKDGNNGVIGSSGSSGQNGNPGCESSGGVFCDSCNTPLGGAGGTSSCGANGGDGGTPGKGKSSGNPGENGVGSLDNGGAGDIGGNWDDMCLYHSGLAVHGGNGTHGTFGTNGSGGGTWGSPSEYGYQPADGKNGTDGSHGQGGGGGGGGCGGTDYCNSYGSSGGGGGAGGCGGTGGTGGTGGGGSFGLWLYKCSNITFENIQLESKAGGAGGAGGVGQSGGAGGIGGDGGAYGGGGEQDDGGCGGWGGIGGSGGSGGHGGGGGGGPSIPLVKIDSEITGLNTTTFSVGSKGPGGKGGGGELNKGADGMSGQYFQN
ncbi:MAG: hypothetical protein ACOX2F_01545 [bacterium]